MTNSKRFRFLLKGMKIHSVNSAYEKDFRLTKETRVWLFDLKKGILSNNDEIEALKTEIKKPGAIFSVDYFWWIPKTDFYTADGSMSQRIGDWSNFPKLPDDEIFNRILGVDDGYICRGQVLKLPYNGRIHCIEVLIGVHSIDSIEKFASERVPKELYA